MRILLCFLLLLSGQVFSKENKYPVSEIPADLMKNVDMIIRSSHTTFTISDQDEARYRVKKAYTILNEEAKHYAVAYLFYDKLSKITEFEASVYDAAGNLVRKLKKNDIKDRSMASGAALYEDSRVQMSDMATGQYPYTVEFEFEKKYNFLFFIPTYALVPHEKVAVQQSSLSLVYPSALAPRYKAIHIDTQPEHQNNGDGTETLSWHFKNIAPIKAEPFGPSLSEIIPRIMLAPSQFEFEGYRGKMDTWENFGKWINSLNKGRGTLPAETKLEAQKLTAHLNSKTEKVKKLYEYMQNKTRYVSIQLGIGGFQPFEATVVDQTGYGDCKALSNYMVALLEAVGIKAHYLFILAGKNAAPIQTDFPSSQFNHAIVAVPNGQDTLWLECTSQTNPFGYLGSFTDDRYALWISDQGGELVKTPSYDAAQNLQARTAEVFLNMNGQADISISTSYQGLQFENGGLFAVLNQPKEQKEWIHQNTDIPSYDLKNFSVSTTKTLIPTAKVALSLFIDRLAAVNGKRIFLTPNLMNRNSFIPETNENRITDIIMKTGWTDFDSIYYHLPEQLYPEFLPEPVHLSSVFGRYDASYSIKEGLLIYQRKISMNEGRYSPDQYAALREFFQKIKKADNEKVVFLNKT